MDPKDRDRLRDLDAGAWEIVECGGCYVCEIPGSRAARIVLGMRSDFWVCLPCALRLLNRFEPPED